MRLLVALVILAALAPRARAAPDKPTPLVIIGELVDKGRPVPPCGRGRFIVMMRYRVIRVVEGTWPEAELWVAQACPDFGVMGKPFRVGEQYRLTLVPDREKYPLTPKPRFVAKKIEPVPPPSIPGADEIQGYFRAHRNRLLACVERASKRDPDLNLVGPFGVTLVWNGTVKDVSFRSIRIGRTSGGERVRGRRGSRRGSSPCDSRSHRFDRRSTRMRGMS